MNEVEQWSPPPRVSMPRGEAKALVGMMVSAWPHSKMSADTIDVIWLPRLAEMDGDTAREAMDQLIDTEEYPPSVAKFREVYTQVRRRRASEHSGAPELPEAPCPPEVAASWRRKIKEQLARAKGPLVGNLGKNLDKTG